MGFNCHCTSLLVLIRLCKSPHQGRIPAAQWKVLPEDPSSFDRDTFTAINTNSLPESAQKPEHRFLNRYRNILPNPKTQVVLSSTVGLTKKAIKKKDPSTVQYINANHLDQVTHAPAHHRSTTRAHA